MADYGGYAPILFQTQGDIPFPNVNPDPALLERMKALAIMRAGAGMMSREPIGNALGAAINTYVSGQEQARREALAQGQLAMEYHKLQKEQLAEKQRAAVAEAVVGHQPTLADMEARVGRPAVMAAIQGGPDKILDLYKFVYAPRKTGEAPIGPSGTGVTLPDANSGAFSGFSQGVPIVGNAVGTGQATLDRGALSAQTEGMKARELARVKYDTEQVKGYLGGREVSMTQREWDQVKGVAAPDFNGMGTKPEAGQPFVWNGNDNPSDIGKAYLQWKSSQTPKSGGYYPNVPPGAAPSKAEEAKAAADIAFEDWKKKQPVTQGMELAKLQYEPQLKQTEMARNLEKHVANLEAYDAKGVFNGTPGQKYAGAANFLNTMIPGYNPGIAAERLGNTDAYNAELSRAQQALGKAFPGQQSNYELEVVTRSLPTLILSPQGRQMIYQAIKNAAKYEQDRLTSMQDHMKANDGNLYNWKPSEIPRIEPAIPTPQAIQEERARRRGNR